MDDIKIERNTKDKIKRTAAQTAVLMAILTLVSKLFGFVREMVMAACFGTSYVVDAYVMAQNIPGMLFAGILSAVSVSFMPLFSEKTEIEGVDSGNNFVNGVLNILLKTSVVIAVFGAVFAKQFVAGFAPGFEGVQAELTVFFLRITFIYIIFSPMNSLLTAYLQYKGVFLPPIMYGYFQSIFVILFVFLGAYLNEKLIVFGLLTGHILIFILLTRLSGKIGLRRDYTVKARNAVKEIMALSLPVFIGAYATQLNTYIDKMLASGLPEGSVAALNYAILIIGLITGLTATIIATVIYPKLNQAFALNKIKEYNFFLCKSFNVVAIITVPCSLGVMAFSNEIVQVIYERGAFDTAATSITAIALFWYGPHLVMSSLNNIITNAFYSNKDMKTPIVLNMISIVVNIILNIVLVRHMGIAGLALATSISGIVGVVLLGTAVKYRLSGIILVESKVKLLKIMFSAIVSVASAMGTYSLLMNAIWMPRLIYLGIAVIIAAIIYLILLALMRIDEIRFIRDIVSRK